jgi:hypothetical protein
MVGNTVHVLLFAVISADVLIVSNVSTTQNCRVVHTVFMSASTNLRLCVLKASADSWPRPLITSTSLVCNKAENSFSKTESY